MFILIQLIQGFANSVGALLTREAVRASALLVQTQLAASKVRLFQGAFTAGPTTTKAQMVAAEADYDGYTSGGNTIATWGAPLDQTSGGVAIAAETTFAYVDGVAHTANTISGGWLEDSTGAVIFPFNFIDPATLNANGTGFVLQLQMINGTYAAT